jgi:UDP-3-O-[3-hydroxymyristoyl] glucosamine N-acyltransferase
MAKTLKEIADLIGGEIIGDENALISGVAGIEDAAAGEITFLSNPKYLPFLARTKASAVITSRDVAAQAKPIIRTDNPSLAFTKVVTFILPKRQEHFKGVHKHALIGKSVKLGDRKSVV